MINKKYLSKKENKAESQKEKNSSNLKKIFRWSSMNHLGFGKMKKNWKKH